MHVTALDACVVLFIWSLTTVLLLCTAAWHWQAGSCLATSFSMLSVHLYWHVNRLPVFSLDIIVTR